MDDDAAYRGHHPGSDLEQFQSNPCHLCTSKCGALQGGAAYVFHQHIRRGTEQNPELIGEIFRLRHATLADIRHAFLAAWECNPCAVHRAFVR